MKMPRAGGGHDEAQIIWLLEAGLSDCLIVPAQVSPGFFCDKMIS